MLYPRKYPQSLIAATLILTLLLIPEVISGQQRQNRSLKKIPWPNEPVKLTKIKVKGAVVELDKDFLAEDDWLNGLTISVKNTSGKAIVFISISIRLIRPATQNTVQQQPSYRHELKYGIEPSSQSLPNEPKPIKPGEIVDIVLSAEDYDNIRMILKQLDYSAGVRQAQVVINTIIFDDDTMWKGGGILRRDRNNPKKWNPIPESDGNLSKRGVERPESSASGFNVFLSTISFSKREVLPPSKIALIKAHPLVQDQSNCTVRLHLYEIFCDDNTGWMVGHWIPNISDIQERRPDSESPGSSPGF